MLLRACVSASSYVFFSCLFVCFCFLFVALRFVYAIMLSVLALRQWW